MVVGGEEGRDYALILWEGKLRLRSHTASGYQPGMKEDLSSARWPAILGARPVQDLIYFSPPLWELPLLYTHFLDEETEAPEGNNLSTFLQLVQR